MRPTLALRLAVCVTLMVGGCVTASSGGGGAGGGGGSTVGGTGGGAALGGAGGSNPVDAGGGGNAGGGGGGGGPVDAGGGGTAGTGGAGGGGGALHGGSSARFICAPGTSYGSPLTGIGTVMQIVQPNVAPIYSFAFIEGPVWIGSRGKIFFSDNAASPAERIIQVTPPSTTASSFMEMSGSNGLAVDNDDNLILADQRNHRIVRVDSSTATAIGAPIATGTFKPNDVLVRSDGNIYFTDPDTGFYRISPTGTLSAAMTQVNRPNGIELSLDERTLYVGDVGNQMIYTFALATDGSVNTASMAPFVTAVSSTVDGMCVDCAGNLYAGTSNGVEIFSPTAARLGVVPTGESSNCTFGDADRRTLYVTSRSVLKYVRLAVPGLPD